MPNDELTKPTALTDVLPRVLAFSNGDVSEIRVFFAPGRVNLIGEHTDYNGGYVLPAALTLGTWLFVRPRQDGVFRFGSTFTSQVVEAHASDLSYREEDGFANYPKGMLLAMQQLGISIPGADFFFEGNLPVGAGLSSSASVEVVVGTAIQTLSGATLSKEQIATLAQRVENEFIGVNSGIMDQFAVAMGQTNCALSLQCATLAYELVPLQMDSVRIVIANTNVSRTLADSKYNERRASCEQALSILQSDHPHAQNLADFSPEEWPQLEPLLTDDVLRRRARHVIFENARAKNAKGLLQNGQLALFGQWMNDSHKSLRDDYEVTGPALDALVEAAWAVDGCIGSRMTGAGFGGCTVSLVREDAVERFEESVSQAYERRIGHKPSFYVTQIGPGACEVTKEVFGQ